MSLAFRSVVARLTQRKPSAFWPRPKDAMKNSALILRSLLADDGSINKEHQIRSFLTDLKARHDLNVREIKLRELDEWNVSGLEISRPDQVFSDHRSQSRN